MLKREYTTLAMLAFTIGAATHLLPWDPPSDALTWGIIGVFCLGVFIWLGVTYYRIYGTLGPPPWRRSAPMGEIDPRSEEQKKLDNYQFLNAGLLFLAALFVFAWFYRYMMGAS